MTKMTINVFLWIYFCQWIIDLLVFALYLHFFFFFFFFCLQMFGALIVTFCSVLLNQTGPVWK